LASDVSESLRRFVAERAAFRCEYCLLHESDSYSPHQIDHIISRKHGGQSDADTLAYACLRCNAWKGSDVGSLDTPAFRDEPFRYRLKPLLNDWKLSRDGSLEFDRLPENAYTLEVAYTEPDGRRDVDSITPVQHGR